MQSIITRMFPAAFLLFALILVPTSLAGNEALDARMKILGSSLKSIKGSLKIIRGTNGVSDKEWAGAKAQAALMAKASDEAKSLYPEHIKGDTNKEKAFRDALADVYRSINEKLIKALTQKELLASEAAVKEIEKKRNAGHGEFMPSEK